ncbi:MAG: porin [Alphaproteobacteria bacterium]
MRMKQGSLALIALLLSAPAQAGDDVESLKQLVRELAQRVNDLEDRLAAKESSRQIVQGFEMPAAAKPLPKPIATPDRMVSSGNDKVKLTVSGQVSRAVLYANNGQRSRFFHVDNDNGSTRFQLKGVAKVAPEWEIGAQIQAQIESNSTVDVDIGKDAASSTVNFTERIMDVFFVTPAGKFTLGQGPTSSDGISEIDLSGTNIIGDGASLEEFAGGITFRKAARPDGTTGPRIRDVWNSLDGLGRRDRIRYDTPSILGFVLGMTHADGDSNDVSLKFQGDFDGHILKAGAAWAKRRKMYNQYNAGVSFLMPCGVSLTGAAAVRMRTALNTDPKVQMAFGKLGYQHKWLECGKTATAVDYGETRNGDQQGDKIRSWGVYVVQHIDPAATELYLGYRRHSLSRPGYVFNTINAAMFGARVKF